MNQKYITQTYGDLEKECTCIGLQEQNLDKTYFAASL